MQMQVKRQMLMIYLLLILRKVPGQSNKQTDRQPHRQADIPEEKNKVNGNGDYNQVRLTSVLQAC